MINKLKALKRRYEELTAALSAPDAMNDQAVWREMVKEHSQLEEIVNAFDEYTAAVQSEADCKAMLEEHLDPEMKDMVHMEMAELAEKQRKLIEDMKIMLLPKDPNDEKNVILEIRAGIGGDEAALFGADLLRMYQRYAERHGYKMEYMNENTTEGGGVKEVVLNIIGRGAYSRLKFESGVHRVQRVPETESQGRIHTSAATVAVMPEAEDVEVEIDPKDLQIDTYRSGGAGGQHVNKTESAIRITHIPTGIVVQCQDERSQHKNKARAMKVLASRLLALEREKQNSEQAAERRLQVGSGDRSERIRTYNFPQGRCTDHRINLTLYSLDKIMQGELDPLLDALSQPAQAEALKAEADDSEK